MTSSMTMLNFHLNNDRNKTVNIFTSDIFKESVRAMNIAMKESSEVGLVSRTRASRPISLEDEENLWWAGVFRME